jgi:hypothetical protein
MVVQSCRISAGSSRFSVPGGRQSGIEPRSGSGIEPEPAPRDENARRTCGEALEDGAAMRPRIDCAA